jgi:DNA-binding response OmpR family regulator
LYERVWGEEAQGDDHTLDVHMSRLRQKLAHDDGLEYLTTVKGIGYKFAVTKRET